MAVPYLACMALVAHIYALPPRVLPSVQAVEGGRPGSVVPNKDGSADLGVMQINTRWLPALVAYTRLPEPVVRDRLTNQPCFNIAAAGAIMRTYLNETHGDLMRAVGNYHSHTEPLNQSYRLLVLRAATMMFQSRAPRS
ncbi:MAG: lytic transglycosylase domain-containing protein [Rhodoferax sp.]|nr:lytic transglycosylase domain-containing protein [Rhodoferax sp.]